MSFQRGFGRWNPYNGPYYPSRGNYYNYNVFYGPYPPQPHYRYYGRSPYSRPYSVRSRNVGHQNSSVLSKISTSSNVEESFNSTHIQEKLENNSDIEIVNSISSDNKIQLLPSPVELIVQAQSKTAQTTMKTKHQDMKNVEANNTNTISCDTESKVTNLEQNISRDKELLNIKHLDNLNKGQETHIRNEDRNIKEERTSKSALYLKKCSLSLNPEDPSQKETIRCQSRPKFERTQTTPKAKRRDLQNVEANNTNAISGADQSSNTESKVANLEQNMSSDKELHNIKHLNNGSKETHNRNQDRNIKGKRTSKSAAKCSLSLNRKDSPQREKNRQSRSKYEKTQITRKAKHRNLQNVEANNANTIFCADQCSNTASKVVNLGQNRDKEMLNIKHLDILNGSKQTFSKKTHNTNKDRSKQERTSKSELYIKKCSLSLNSKDPSQRETIRQNRPKSCDSSMHRSSKTTSKSDKLKKFSLSRFVLRKNNKNKNDDGCITALKKRSKWVKKSKKRRENSIIKGDKINKSTEKNTIFRDLHSDNTNQKNMKNSFTERMYELFGSCSEDENDTQLNDLNREIKYGFTERLDTDTDEQVGTGLEVASKANTDRKTITLTVLLPVVHKFEIFEVDYVHMSQFDTTSLQHVNITNSSIVENDCCLKYLVNNPPEIKNNVKFVKQRNITHNVENKINNKNAPVEAATTVFLGTTLPLPHQEIETNLLYETKVINLISTNLKFLISLNMAHKSYLSVFENIPQKNNLEEQEIQNINIYINQDLSDVFQKFSSELKNIKIPPLTNISEISLRILKNIYNNIYIYKDIHLDQAQIFKLIHDFINCTEFHDIPLIIEMINNCIKLQTTMNSSVTTPAVADCNMRDVNQILQSLPIDLHLKQIPEVEPKPNSPYGKPRIQPDMEICKDDQCAGQKTTVISQFSVQMTKRVEHNAIPTNVNLHSYNTMQISHTSSASKPPLNTNKPHHPSNTSIQNFSRHAPNSTPVYQEFPASINIPQALNNNIAGNISKSLSKENSNFPTIDSGYVSRKSSNVNHLEHQIHLVNHQQQHQLLNNYNMKETLSSSAYRQCQRQMQTNYQTNNTCNYQVSLSKGQPNNEKNINSMTIQQPLIDRMKTSALNHQQPDVVPRHNEPGASSYCNNTVLGHLTNDIQSSLSNFNGMSSQDFNSSWQNQGRIHLAVIPTASNETYRNPLLQNENVITNKQKEHNAEAAAFFQKNMSGNFKIKLPFSKPTSRSTFTIAEDHLHTQPIQSNFAKQLDTATINKCAKQQGTDLKLQPPNSNNQEGVVNISSASIPSNTVNQETNNEDIILNALNYELMLPESPKPDISSSLSKNLKDNSYLNNTNNTNEETQDSRTQPEKDNMEATLNTHIIKQEEDSDTYIKEEVEENEDTQNQEELENSVSATVYVQNICICSEMALYTCICGEAHYCGSICQCKPSHCRKTAAGVLGRRSLRPLQHRRHRQQRLGISSNIVP